MYCSGVSPHSNHTDLVKKRVSLPPSLHLAKPLDGTKQQQVFPASQIVPQDIKLGADPHTPPHPVETPLVSDAAAVHKNLPSCGRQNPSEAVDGCGLACSIWP